MPASSSAAGWDSWTGLYPKQNYTAQVVLQQSIGNRWELPGHQIKVMPTQPYPVPMQGYGGGALAPTPSGGVQVARGIRGPGPGGSIIDVEVRQVIPKRKIASRIVQSLPVVGTVVGGALLIKDLIDAARIMEGPGGTILMDPGQPEITEEGYRGKQTDCLSIFPSAAAAHNCDMAVIKDTWEQGNPSLRYVVVQSSTCEPTSPGSQSYICRTYYETWSCPAGDGTCTKQQNLSYIQTYGPVTGQLCPPGQVVSFWQDDWCTSPPEEWLPATVEDATDRLEPKIAPGAAPDLLRELDGKDIGVDGDLPTVTGPTSLGQGREVTVNPDGSTTVKDTTSDIRYGTQPDPTGELAPGWDWSDRTETRTYPPGAEIPAPGEDPNPPDTSTEGGASEDIITCGLPWTPACKMDETGTPQPVATDVYGDPGGPTMEPLNTIIGEPPAPEVEWSWTFELPAGCTPFPLPAFAPYMDALDVCQFQPTIHDLVSLMWVGATFWALIALISGAFKGGQ